MMIFRLPRQLGSPLSWSPSALAEDLLRRRVDRVLSEIWTIADCVERSSARRMRTLEQLQGMGGFETANPADPCNAPRGGGKAFMIAVLEQSSY